jgi:hypothetical protein
MDKDRLLEILKKEPNDIDAIGMILSNYTDFGSSEGGMVSVKQFRIVAECLIEWWEGKRQTTDEATAILPDVSGWRLLHLSLKKEPFQVMITEEKPIEFRKDTESGWIRSRLLTPNGDKKEYDGVLFTNGYGNDKPYFIAEYRGFTFAQHDFTEQYSNGLNVEVEQGDFQIFLGKVVKKGNV